MFLRHSWSKRSLGTLWKQTIMKSLCVVLHRPTRPLFWPHHFHVYMLSTILAHYKTKLRSMRSDHPYRGGASLLRCLFSCTYKIACNNIPRYKVTWYLTCSCASRTLPTSAYRPRHGACDDAVKNVGIERKQTLCDVDGSSFGE